LSAKKVSMGISVLMGLIVAAIVGVLLDVMEVPAGSAAGALIGGLIAGLLLYTHRRGASLAGFVVGVFSFPVELALLVSLVSANLYTPPPVPEIPQSTLYVALAVTVLMQVVAGTIGGLIGGVIRHQPPGTKETPSPYVPPPPPIPEKYCIQCGAGLAKTTMICPACKAKQPA
jgi:hypothetical protein